MKGKNKCKILKEIRKAIAKENNIEYITSECKYQGECSGTCPKCEAEVRYLEAELEKRRYAGKSVAVAGIATSMILSTGCIFTDKLPQNQLMGDIAYSESSEQPNSEVTEGEIVSQVTQSAPIFEVTQQGQLVDGEIMIESSEEAPEEEISSTDTETEDVTEEILMGDILISEEELVVGEVPEPEK